MKKILLLLFVFPAILISQNSNENYVKTIIHKKDSSASFINVAPDNTVMVNVTYFDGLGRPKQHIAHKQSGSGGDLVTHVEYDGLGRQPKQFLPFERTASSSIDFDEYAEVNTNNFYNTSYYQNTQNPYSETDFENSPLNRVLRQAAPGNLWAMGSGREIKMEYKTNHASEVYHFKVNNPNGTPTLVLNTSNNGRYPANQLYKTITKDENWQTGNEKNAFIEEFKNKLGQVVLKRVYTSTNEGPGNPTSTILDTYYVYDDYGNLTFVLSPKLSEQIVTNGSLTGNHQHLLNELGYRYRYDHRNRLVQKKLPGKQAELITYDALNRVVSIAPVQSPFMNDDTQGVLITRYDHYNRVAYTVFRPSWISGFQTQGLEAPQTHISESRTTQATYIDGIPVFYTNQVNPNSSDKLLTVNYYDDYNFPGAPSSIPAKVGENNDIDVYYNNTTKPKGMPTGSWTRALENTTDANGITTYTLYDVKSRPVRVHSTNHMGGFTQTDTDYDFIGKVISTYTTHQKESASDVVSIRENMEYTDQERMQKLSHTINQGNEEMLMFNEYDALGQLKAKKVGGTSESSGNFHQKVDYNYNIRGWLTDINNVTNLVQTGEPQDLFAFKIYYTQVTNTVNGSVTPLYNGNIAETQWRTSGDNIRRRYGYTYDFTNRLTDAWYSIPSTAVIGSYNEHLTYDANGNIMSLQRYGEVENAQGTIMIDDLDYFYDDGNKLINVTDKEGDPAGFNDGNSHTPIGDDDFEYDDFGNLIIDRNKNIDEITYNHLNLPKKIIFDIGEIHYIYDANGTKLKKIVNDHNTSIVTDTHYLDGFQYTDDHLDFFPHAEGYVNVLDFEEFNYVYTYKDHLGNIRLRYTLDPQTDVLAILEEDHYYPFGLKHIGYNGSHEMFGKITGGGAELVPVNNIYPEKYKYKFNGMEYQSEFNINLYDFGARNYDPALGRWMNIDPLAEMMRRHSPYNFAFNNPIVYIDPDGMAPDWYSDNDGNIVYNENIRSQEDLDCAGIEGVYIGDSFVGIDQNQSVYRFNEDGTVNRSNQDEIGEGDAVVAIETSIGEMTQRTTPSKGEQFLQEAGVALVVSQADTPAPGPGDVLALGILYNAIKNLIIPQEIEGYYNLEFAKSKAGESKEVEGAEHTAGARKSTKNKHEKGQTRKQQKNRDKKRNKPNWKQY